MEVIYVKIYIAFIVLIFIISVCVRGVGSVSIVTWILTSVLVIFVLVYTFVLIMRIFLSVFVSSIIFIASLSFI